jgi:hypothetical protein
MRGPRGARRSAKSRFASIIRNICIFLLVMFGSSLLLFPDLNVSRGYEPPVQTALHGTIVTNGADRWNGDEEVTVPDFDFPAPAARILSVSPLFQTYYSDHSGATSLEAPVTPAFPIGQGWIQFFATGALLLPVAQHAHPRDTGEDAVEDSLELLIESGVRDSNSGIIRLPLLRALLTVGSFAPVGGDGSSLTYADLRRATDPNLMRPEPAAGQQLAQASGESQSMFIKTGMRAGKDIGHLAPPAIWNYIRRPDISPDGREKDFGAPLTEAISFPLLKDGQIHRMLVQAFRRDGVVIDQTAFDAWGYPLIQRLATSVDYLRTLDLPPLVMSARQTAWAQGETALLNAPGGSQVVANIEPYFQLTLLGDSAWRGGML